MAEDDFEKMLKDRWPHLIISTPISVDQARFNDDLKDFVSEMLKYMEDTNRRIYNLEQQLAEVKNGLHSDSTATSGSSGMVRKHTTRKQMDSV